MLVKQPTGCSSNMIPKLLPMAWTMLPLVLLYGCLYGLDYHLVFGASVV
jgi:hypothetical protein